MEEGTAPKQEKIVVEYDSDARQSVPLKITDNGRISEVEHLFEPVLDGAYFSHDELRETLLQPVSGKELETISNSTNADFWLWKEHCYKVLGYGDDDEHLPENWKELLLDGDTQFDALKAVELLIACEAIVEKVTDKGRRSFGSTNKTIRTRAYFNGEQVEMSHHFKSKTANDIDEYRKLTNRLRLSQGDKVGRNDMKLPRAIKAKCKLYKSLIESTEGYLGRVPALHQAVALDAYFESTAEQDEKK